MTSWPALFSHPLFRKGWHDHRNAVNPTEGERGTVVYLFGRLMAAEAAGLALPVPADSMTRDMVAVIRACPAFERQMVTAQYLQAGGDPARMTEERGLKQGDET